VQVSYSEGLANHTGPESCVGIREDVGEALTGERIGQPSSRESLIFPDADVVEITEGNMGSAITRAPSPAWSKTLSMCGSSLHGNREASGLAGGWTPPVRVGKTRSRSRRCTDPRSLIPL
jgi:hypothetical protein